jgi:hypothetical protein
MSGTRLRAPREETCHTEDGDQAHDEGWRECSKDYIVTKNTPTRAK